MHYGDDREEGIATIMDGIAAGFLSASKRDGLSGPPYLQRTTRCDPMTGKE
jgi:hypothetical protein